MTSQRFFFPLQNTAMWLFLAIVLSELALYLFLFLIPNLMAPQGHTYTFIHDDYVGSAITQEGASDVSPILNPRVTEPTPPLAGYGIDVLIGKIAHTLSIPPLVAYQIARIIGGLLLCASILWLMTLCIPKSYYSLAIILTLLLETGPNISDVLTKPLREWSTLFMNQSAVYRHFGNPNDIWTQAIALSLLCCVINATRKPSLRFIPFIIILGFVGTLSIPSYTLSMLLLILLPLLIYASITKKASQTFPPILLTSITIAVALFIMLNQISGNDQLATYMKYSQLLSGNLTISSLFHLYSLYTPFLLLFLFFAPLRWKAWDTDIHRVVVMCITWSMLPTLIAYVFQFLNLPLPIMLNAFYITPIPIAFLSTIGFMAFTENFSMNRVRLPITIALLAIVFGSSLLLTSIYAAHILSDSQSPSNYLSGPEWEGIFALKSLPVFTGVLALPQSGELIPIYVPVRMFVGLQDGSDDWQIRRGSALQFFSGMLDPQAARQFLKNNDISYVWVGPLEKALLLTAHLYPTTLGVLFQNKEVTIYKVL